MLTKEKVLSATAALPEYFSLDDLVERLLLIDKIEIGLSQINKGLVLSQDEVKNRVKSWRK